ncbi:hypothetical protein CFC21_016782 [Triticum aestivum]|uniref:STI1/HOP DP domain-containing protein n=3 Tax=Triticum TaxID=4564 RepID=A0A9R1R6R4_TRITD|nr:hypothetical protein CFC21_016782 [Triticum aestivum]VAH30355.1 unnamed protein product [Triticum turgidum subsp. durum]
MLWCQNYKQRVRCHGLVRQVVRILQRHNVSACLPSIPNILKLRCLITRGVQRCIQQINKANRGKLTPEELKERQGKAMQDPEIQNILTDPVMQQVLIDFQENPRAA